MRKRIETVLVRMAAAFLIFFMGCQDKDSRPPTPAGTPVPAVEDTVNKPEPQVSQSESEAERSYGENTQAVAEMKAAEGEEVHGKVIFTREKKGIRVSAELKGLTPGRHGIHIHEKGDCSAPKAGSAGGHFDPEGHPHGAPPNPPSQRHVGDLGNLEAREDGSAAFETVDKLITFSGDHSILGRSVVVHAGPDDFTSQPAGDSGPPVACGVIEETGKR